MKLETSDLVGFIKQRHYQQIKSLRTKLSLAIAMAGDEAASASFIRAKQRYAQDVGVNVVVETSKSEHQLLQQLTTWSHDDAIIGIVVQLPLPANFGIDRVIAEIAATKDIDGLRPDPKFEAATVKAIMWILAAQNIKLPEADVCVVGQGRLVGLPVSASLEAAGAKVSRCDINTPDLAAHTRAADIVVSGVGHPGLIKPAMLKDLAIVIDAGTSEAAGQLAGDAAPELYEDPRVRVTPVPGGVGPMTVAALFDNLLIAGSS